MMIKRPRTSTMWSYFEKLNASDKLAKCDMCGARLSYRSTLSNLKNHIIKKHPTVNLNVSSSSYSSTTPSCPSSTKPITTVQSDHPKTTTINISSIPTVCGPSSSSSFISVCNNVSNKPIDSKNSENIDSTAVTILTTPKQTQLEGFVTQKMSAGPKRKIDKSLLRLFTQDFQPFTVIEDKGFKKFVHNLNPHYSLPDRKTITSSWIPAAFEECKNRVFDKLIGVKGVCLTTDCWSSSAQESYLAVTGHYITDNFEFESVLLDCCLIEGQHIALSLANQIREITDRFGLTDKVQIVISDNGANIKAAIKKELQWPHFGCYADTLNLIVNDALQNSGIINIIDNVKNIVKHFKKSNQDLEKLLKFQKDAGNEPRRLIMAVATRWNSTFYMLERCVQLEAALRATLALTNKELPTLSIDEWKIITDVCKVLKPFEEVTRKLSGEKYVSGSQIVLLTTGLTNVCQKLIQMNLHQMALKLAQEIQEGILIRFANVESNSVIGLSSFLDPRFKLCPFASPRAQNTIKELANKLGTKEYNASVYAINTNQSHVKETPHEEEEGLSVTAFFDEVVRSTQSAGTALSSAIVEINRYLDERTIGKTDDPLKWWNDNKNVYPTLSKIVKERFCMVATSVPCERIFSKTGLIISDRRTRLKSSNVQKLIFLNANEDLWS